MKKITATLIGAALLALPVTAAPADASSCLRIKRGTNICVPRPPVPWLR